MKTISILGPLLLSVLLASPLRCLAESLKTEPAPPRELSIVVIDSLIGPGANSNAFDRIDRVFTKVFKERKWPMTIAVERFASNTPSHETELKIFYKGIGEESFQDLTIHAWMTLTDHDKKWDFGVVRFTYYPRVGQHKDDVLDYLVMGAAEIAADKIEAALFPKPATKKP